MTIQDKSILPIDKIKLKGTYDSSLPDFMDGLRFAADSFFGGNMDGRVSEIEAGNFIDIMEAQLQRIHEEDSKSDAPQINQELSRNEALGVLVLMNETFEDYAKSITEKNGKKLRKKDQLHKDMADTIARKYLHLFSELYTGKQ